MTDQPNPTRPNPSKKKRLFWIALVAVLVIGAGVFIGSRIYAANVSAQAEEAPTISLAPSTDSSDAASTGSAPDTTDGTWNIEAGSYAGYRLNEVLNGADVTVTGRTEEVSGSLTVANDELTAAKVSLQVAEISTDSERRDQYFRGTAVNTAQFPEATFTLTEPVNVSTASAGGQQKFEITGELSLNGRTVSVTAAVEAAFVDGQAQLVGQIPMTWSEFAVEAPNLGFVSVEDHGFIEFSLNVEQN